MNHRREEAAQGQVTPRQIEWKGREGTASASAPGTRQGNLSVVKVDELFDGAFGLEREVGKEVCGIRYLLSD